MVTLSEALARVLAEAVPGDAIEVTLTEAQGLVLAEPLVADVDLPPFDRAAIDGYAVRSADVESGSRLDVLVARRGGPGGARTAEVSLGRGETTRVSAGDPMPVGADAVIPTAGTRPEPDSGPPAEVLSLLTVATGHGVVPRGALLRAGTAIAGAGTRLRPPMVPLLAAEGCVHPLCHRRARVAVISVGDHLVAAAEAPVMHRERNAGGPTVLVPCLQWGATAHDLGAVAERELPSALHRALSAPVVVILAEPAGAIPRALKRAGVEPLFEEVSIRPGGQLRYGVLRDGSGRAAHHVFTMSPHPVGVLAGVMLILGPLIARLHGGPALTGPRVRALWSGPSDPPTDDRISLVPVTLAVDEQARLCATAVEYRGKDDLLGYSAAEALALLPPASGARDEGEMVEVVSMWTGTGLGRQVLRRNGLTTLSRTGATSERVTAEDRRSHL